MQAPAADSLGLLAFVHPCPALAAACTCLPRRHTIRRLSSARRGCQCGRLPPTPRATGWRTCSRGWRRCLQCLLSRASPWLMTWRRSWSGSDRSRKRSRRGSSNSSGSSGSSSKAASTPDQKRSGAQVRRTFVGSLSLQAAMGSAQCLHTGGSITCASVLACLTNTHQPNHQARSNRPGRAARHPV